VTISVGWRALVISAAAAAATAAPVAVGLLSAPAAQPLAQCGGFGGINVNVLQEGAPTGNCPPAPVAPPVGGPGAPSQGLLTACGGVPGCLSNALYGPGNVVVPNPNTRVHQSQ
jgi:hypothetical protein